MPYARDLSNLKPLIEEALKTDEMLDGMADSGVSKETLTAELEKKSEQHFESVGAAIKMFDDLERRHAGLSFTARLQSTVFWAVLSPAGAFFVAGAIDLAFPFMDDALARILPDSWLPHLGWVSALAVTIIIPVVVRQRYLLRATRTELEALRRRLDEWRGTVEKGVVDAIQAECRAIFEQRSTPSYETELKVVSASGLAEVPGTSRAVDTKARGDLREMMKMMPGGSIGIAGPRGAGKTTLIWEYCCGAVAKLKERPVLGVMTSAPVEYEARDFILYIFLSVCRAVLKEFGADPNAPPWLSDAGPLARFARREYRVAGFALAYVGLMLLATTFYLTPAPPTILDPAPQTAPGIFRTIRAIGITPLHTFVAGLLLTLPAAAMLLAGYFARRPEPAPRSKKSSHPVGAADAERYVQKAWAWMKMIKFQQSFTSGWSGALKLPIGLEGNANRAASLAENQKSLPEIVGGLREFLADLSADFQVVVGIDELDKLESDESAQRFVNEIKSVFGLERCFYLVSVSESAMSNFERRGLPFRDAFDSSFDNIIRVDYLTLDAAKRLIARRVVGMPMPFRGLCFCLSGGLARDLIRACRNLVQLAPAEGEAPDARTLSALCGALIRQDLRAKVHAVITSAGKIELEPEGPAFIAALYRLESAVDGRQPLLPECAGLNVSLSRALSADREEAKLLAARRLQLAALGKELTTYVYYSDTVLRFFGSDYAEWKLKAAESGGGRDSLNYLARARQSLGVNPAVAKSIIDDFRRERGLPVESLWEQPTGDAHPQPENGAARNGGGPQATAFVITGAPATLQKSIEGLKGMLDSLGATPEEG
jgi:hypothetical protein